MYCWPSVIFIIVLSTLSSSDKTHWPVENLDLITLEATAYALLALVKVKVSITHLRYLSFVKSKLSHITYCQHYMVPCLSIWGIRTLIMCWKSIG